MEKATVVVIGGGATGTGILRDLSMRGIDALLVEQGDLASGTSSRFHGLLHSGARYAVGDPDAARECIAENRILRRIGSSCVEQTEGYFVRTPEDDPAHEHRWVAACQACGIAVEAIDVAEARRREPALSPLAQAVYRVPDSAVDGFRLVWHNVMSARRYGGRAFTYCKVTGIEQQGGRACGLTVLHTRTGQQQKIACDYIINATGSWAGELAHLAGLDVPVKPDRGTLIAFNHRFTDRVINRLRPSTDGDIFVPHGSITIFGTTSIPTRRPDDTTPTSREVIDLLAMGEPLFPRLRSYRILRAFAGTRPLYSPDASTGRAATRNFVIIDHAQEGLAGMASITGGKFTSFRLMAEKITDLACAALGNSTPCRTAHEAIIPDPAPELLQKAATYFPAGGLDLAVARLGDDLAHAVACAEKSPWKKLLLCECELVTMAEFEVVAKESTSHSLGDIRRRTRLGMGTCQGSFCALRATGALREAGLFAHDSPQNIFRQFLEERWHGIRPLLWGNQLREVELERGIYGASLNIDGACGPTSEGNASAPSSCPPPFMPLMTETAAMPETPAAAAIPFAPVNSASVHTAAATGYDVIVVGAGFAGLVAATTAARRGKRTLVISKGAGALTIGGGTVDILGYIGRDLVLGDPLAAIHSLAPNHPYRLIGTDGIRASLDFIRQLAREAGAPLLEAGSHATGNAWLPTAAGTMKPTWYSSPGMNPALLAECDSFAVVGLTGMKDFSPQLVAEGLSACPQFAGKSITHSTISSPLAAEGGASRDISALDLAYFIDSPKGTDWLRSVLPAAAGGAQAVFLPTILGTRPDHSLHSSLERQTGLRILELFCPPPSVTGLRMLAMLRHAMRSLPITFIEGATVIGAESEGPECRALIVQATGKRRRYSAPSYIIATGGLFSSGIVTAPHEAREAVFSLPIAVPGQVEDWSCHKFFGREPHFFASMGVSVNSSLNPVGDNGELVYSNVHFAGRTLGGYDFATEKSGSGVALASGYHAGSLV